MNKIVLSSFVCVNLCKVLLVCCVFFATPALWAFELSEYNQQKKLSVEFVNAPLRTVLEYIEKNSEYVFLNQEGTVNDRQKVTVDVKDQTIDQILQELFPDLPISYEIKDRQILLKKKESSATPQTGNTQQQLQKIKVQGTVTDKFDQAPIVGASVRVLGTGTGVVTDLDGVFSVNVHMGDSLEFSYVGYEKQVIKVNKKVINVMLAEQNQMLEEAVIVAFGKQKKESVVSSISTVDTRELRAPTSNLTVALAGKLPGLVAYQTTGAPGEDNAQFFVRSVTSFGSGLVSPLILIDNMQATSTDLARLSPDDLASFSILKDASATALYGARGANGVVLVTTKEGKQGKPKVSVRVESSLSTPTTNVDIADPIKFMEYANIASMTRHNIITYEQSKIDNTRDPNRNPYVYPAVDWREELTRKQTFNHRANINVSGGGNMVTYYLAGSISRDNGILEAEPINPFNTNIKFTKYTLRSNVNLKLTKTTEMKVKMNAGFDNYTGPIGEYGSGGVNTYKKCLIANPVLFPMVFRPDEKTQYLTHRVLFGNYSDDKYGTGAPKYLNPYADLMKGYENVKNSNFAAQMELHQDLKFITPGLKMRAIGNVTRYSGFNIQRSYKPFYYQYIQGTYDPSNTQFPYTLSALNPEGGSEFIDYSAGDKSVSTRLYGEVAGMYNRTFNDKHDVGGLFVASYTETMHGSPKNLDSSLPSRNVSFAGRFTYGYNKRYFTEFNFGINGSERFDPDHRWGFFPSIGVGWRISNERFWGPIKKYIPLLVIRGTYGLTGNDVIISEQDRFFFTSNVNLNGGAAGYFGMNPNETYTRPTIEVGRYANPNITWEVSHKANLAIELGLLDEDLTITTEFYKERRENIVQARPDIPNIVGLTTSVQTNYGESEGKGIDIAVKYNKSLMNSMWYIVRGNFTYGTSKITKYEELDYSSIAPWKAKVGRKVGQLEGYVAERLFIDDMEVANSPKQQVSSAGGIYQAGDIKYRDVNDDGVVNSYDIVPMGYSANPEIQYGFGASFGYKNFDCSFFFQGQSHYSFFLDAGSMTPFVEVTSGGMKGNRAMLDFIADNCWTEENRNPYAKWPRLSSDTGNDAYGNNNNNVRSNYWMRNLSYIRLKSVEMGYTFPKFKGVSVRLYLSGLNLFTLSDFDMWDPEMGGNGLAYPLQRVYNVGLLVNF